MVCKICLAEVKGEAARLGRLSSPGHRQKSIAASSYNNNASYTPCTVRRALPRPATTTMPVIHPVLPEEHCRVQLQQQCQLYTLYCQKSIAASSYNNNASYTPCTVRRALPRPATKQQ
jgi:hypothetical protein